MASRPMAGPDPRPPRRILVVDDERDAADALRLVLVVKGEEAEVAYSAEEALEALRTRTPDVVICDILMPGMDGLAFARAVRRDGRLRAVVLIALTGQGSREAIARCREAGFDGYLMKPVVLDVLTDLLAAYCP